MTTEQTTIAEKVAQVNTILQQDETCTPLETLSSISKDNHTGYYGYKPQHIVDAMNAVFSYDGWGFKEVKSEIREGGLAVAQVEVWLKGVEFKPQAWGQSKVTRGDVGDALKGANTDGLKKALSYFSIGNRAYRGLLEEVYKQAEAAAAKAAAQAAAAERKAAAARNQNNNSRSAQPQANNRSASIAPAAPVKETPAAEPVPLSIEQAIEKGQAQPVQDLAERMQIQSKNGVMSWARVVCWAYNDELKAGTKKRADLEARANAGRLVVDELQTVYSKMLALQAQRAQAQKAAAPALATV